MLKKLKNDLIINIKSVAGGSKRVFGEIMQGKKITNNP
jgi:hypothetical protein